MGTATGDSADKRRQKNRNRRKPPPGPIEVRSGGMPPENGRRPPWCTAGLLACGSSPRRAFPVPPGTSGLVRRYYRLQLRGQLRNWTACSNRIPFTSSGWWPQDIVLMGRRDHNMLRHDGLRVKLLLIRKAGSKGRKPLREGPQRTSVM